MSTSLGMEFDQSESSLLSWEFCREIFDCFPLVGLHTPGVHISSEGGATVEFPPSDPHTREWSSAHPSSATTQHCAFISPLEDYLHRQVTHNNTHEHLLGSVCAFRGSGSNGEKVFPSGKDHMNTISCGNGKWGTSSKLRIFHRLDVTL